ncbi:hypothetical protein JW756_01495 [Candidatus Woesearchaeota archaeon]|nr:hypothetical protein [Candidatus Woesearchaeota archaeon]
MIYLVRYAEIALKGKNRSEFEKRLMTNIRSQLSAFKPRIKQLPGRLLVEAEHELDFRRVFGNVSYSPCTKTSAEIKAICSEALKQAENHEKTTSFKISARRLTKERFSSSLELNKQIGAFIVQKKGWKVDLEKPDLDICVEIIDDEAFLFTKTINCFGGLPAGVEGKVLALVSDEKSILAALLIMRRGCAVELVASSDTNYSLLQEFCPYKLILHKIKKIPEIDEIAKKLDCKAIITSDTLTNIKQHPINMFILMPLIAFSEEEIQDEMKKYLLIK